MLDLNDLDTDDIPGIGRERGADLAKAGAVCLESQGHNPGVQLAVRGISESSYTLTWPEIICTPSLRGGGRVRSTGC